MENDIDFDEEFGEKMEYLEENIDNLLLDLMNIADLKFKSDEEFDQAKAYLRYNLKREILYLIARMKRKRVFDTDIKKD